MEPDNNQQDVSNDADVLTKPITTPIASLTLGLITALVLTTTLNGFVSLKYTINQLASQQNSYAAISSVAKNKVKDNNSVVNLESEETNRVIVKFKDDAKLPPGLSVAAEKANLEKAQGLNHVLTINGIEAQVYEISEDDTATEVVQRLLAKHKDVIEYAEVDMLVAPSLVPNDPYYPNAWHLPKIEAPAAWDSIQGASVTVAILDSGADPNHPDLNFAPNVGWDFYYGNSDWSDVYGHGTIVSGAAVATMDNLAGVAGVAGKALLMPVQVANDNDGYAFWSSMTSGIIYAADNGARVVNLSFQACDSNALSDAAGYMRDRGGVVLVAAGNTGTELTYPVSTNITCVSATGSGDTRPSWSSYGNYVDVAAPGVGIYTTVKGGGYGGASGTSLSTPVVSGVYALMFSANPSLTAAEADAILFQTALDIGSAGWDMYYGHGRVNAFAAVQAALNMQGSQDTEAPTTPANLNADNVTDRSVTLNWLNSTDNVLVTGYNVYRDGEKITTTSNTNYTDVSLSSNSTYVYEVSAIDKAGNESARSASVSVNTLDVAFDIAGYSVISKSNSDATIGVDLTKLGTVTVRYGTNSGNLDLSVDSSELNTNHSLNLTGLSSRTTYYYQVIAVDQSGATVSSSVSSFKTPKGGGGSGGGGNSGKGNGKPSNR
ncbi:MAG: S8 family serine peptidase [Candidatus Paceibacterota bacterium]